MGFRIAAAAAAFGLAAVVPAQAAPCMIVTITGAQGGPQAYQGQAGPGTLVRYGDDADNCNAVRLQFDAGRGTLLRLSQINVLSSADQRRLLHPHAQRPQRRLRRSHPASLADLPDQPEVRRGVQR